MKKLLVFLFALAAFLCFSGHAFGQAYSSTVLQNSAGNYGRPVPYPQVLVCVPWDTNVPCISRATTYFDDTLTTQCTQTGSSGLLIGNPTSGANCNNPGIGDVNGNFTIYVAGGEYMICTYSGTWLCQKQTIGGGNSGSGIVNACTGGANCNAYYPLPNVPSIVGDPLVTDDGAGNEAGKTFTTTQTGIAGFHYFTQGSAPILSVNNSVYFYAPVSVSTYAWVLPGSAGSGCMQASNASGLVTISFTGVNCGTGSGATFQVNGTNTSSQTTINYQSGTGITVTNPSAGNVLFTASAGQLSNPVAPTITPLGTTGATTYSYVIVGCEDGNTCASHSAATNAGTTTTGNAALVSTGCPASCSAANQISAYVDTTYGYRCVNVYRTAGGGSTGKIATCVDKTFIDTGLAGDSSTAPATNTTATIATMNPTSGGCNYPSGSPQGIDGLPCSPNAYDEEFTPTFGIADANDPFYQWLNQNGATATLTGGLVSISNAHQASNQLNCLIKPLPSAPYTFVGLAYPQMSVQNANAGWLAVGLYESATGKLITLDFLPTGTLTTSHWTSASAFSANVANNSIVYSNNGVYFKIARSGTTLTLANSADGITYGTGYTETTTTWFTTAPDNLAICVNPKNGNSVNVVADFDYVRRTQ